MSDNAASTSEDGASRVKSVTGLPRDHFDVVVFCFLLEYLPTPAMRYDAVKKAAAVLADYGLLVIVTPDSSHQVDNSTKNPLKLGFKK